MADLWRDALGFGGAVIIRRLVGIAHVADMDSIEGGCGTKSGALLCSWGRGAARAMLCGVQGHCR